MTTSTSTGALALLAWFAAIFGVLGTAGAWAVGAAAQLWPGLAARLSPAHRRAASPALRAAVVLAPAMLAVLGCVALASPAPFSAGCHCASHGLHHPHLCLHHPQFAMPLAGAAAVLLGAWAAIAAPRLLRLAREWLAAARWARAIRRLPVTSVGGVPVRVVPCGAPGAFTVGALAPVIVFDQGLFEGLSEEERRAVAHHEEGHAARRDPLTLLALRAAAALFPMPGARARIEAWRDAAEATCDSYAAARLGDAAAVAAALVAVERAREAAGSAGEPPALAALALGAPAGARLAERVHGLLDGLHGDDSARRRLRNDALAAGIVTLGAAALAALWPGDLIHHAVETLLGWLAHSH